jgi:hypothetical protein
MCFRDPLSRYIIHMELNIAIHVKKEVIRYGFHSSIHRVVIGKLGER